LKENLYNGRISRKAMFENFQEKPDEELAVLALGSQAAFLYLVERYEDRLMRYIFRIAGLNQEDAEDLLQEVFIKVYKNLNNFDSELKFSSWIYRICHNQVISNYRKLKARPQNIYWEKKDDWLNNIISEFDLERETDLALDREFILKVLDKLDYKYKEVLELRFLEDRDYKEISDILKKPMGTVATLINRAKKQFQKYAKHQ